MTNRTFCSKVYYASGGRQMQISASGSVGGARPCQGRGRGFESRLALLLKSKRLLADARSLFDFNKALPGLECSSDLGSRSFAGSGNLGQTLPARSLAPRCLTRPCRALNVRVTSATALHRGAVAWVRPSRLALWLLAAYRRACRALNVRVTSATALHREAVA